MAPRLNALPGAVLVLFGLLAGSAFVTGGSALAGDGSGTRVPNAPVVVAAGDIACEPGLPAAPSSHTCQQAATARLAASFDPAAVLVLGDSQYETGALRDYLASYSQSWGALLAITRPVPGNHEYGTPGAAGYYSYFKTQQPGPPGYYAYNIDTWRLYALNGECTMIDCARERAWLAADLNAHPKKCSLMYMHEPRFSSGGGHGNYPPARGFWRVGYRHHVDIALGGHDHDYERFALLDYAGNRTARGIQSFVVGTGGRSLYGFGAVQPGSIVRFNDSHGVLALTLRAGSYAWEFRTIGGVTVDSGSRTCR